MNIHFIGIGGISMSALAKICINKGYNVSGSDISSSPIIEDLKRLGAKIYLGQKKENITDDVNMVIYTAAINPNNEELIEAQSKNNILVMNRAAFLGQIMREYSNSIAVSGTHGKTTTTSMLSTIFDEKKLDPTILVGGNLSSIGGNVKIGHSKHFITEACEYVDSFLNLNPKIAIVLNIEEDHLDYFSGLEEIKASFNKFGKLLPHDGYFIINGDNPNTRSILHDVEGKIINFGIGQENDVKIKNIEFDEDGFGTFDLDYFGEDFGTFTLSVRGTHNIYNATAAIIASYVSGIDLEDIRHNIKDYYGVGRRFEDKGYRKGAKIVDDYAHHPTELKATLAAANSIRKNKLWVVFQPHTYSRTKSLLTEFADAFYAADKVIITDIYAAREKDPGDIHSKDLVDRLVYNNIDAIYISDFDDIVDYLDENIEENDLVITAGAGPVNQIGERLVTRND